MKVLVVSTPGAGHVRPMGPLARALVELGDRVVLAAGPEARAPAEAEGCEFQVAGHGEAAWFETLRARTRGAPGDGLAPERINHYFVPRLFAEIGTDDMVDDVVACARDLQPDVVVFETYAFAGPLVAELLGVPAVHHLISPMLEPDVLALSNDAVSPLWRSFGRDAPGYAGVYRDLTIEICPGVLEPLRPPQGTSLRMRPTGGHPRARVPRERPLVYVTLGTMFNSNLDVFRTVLDGVAGEPVDVVVTVGADQDPAGLGPTPSNVAVEGFVPQDTLMPTCAAVVHHGGSGTTLGALAHGLPQVVVPQGADNFINAGLLERAGAARVVLPDDLDSDGVRRAVRAVLSEPAFTAAAEAAAAEMAAMPSPQEMAAALHERYGAPRRSPPAPR